MAKLRILSVFLVFFVGLSRAGTRGPSYMTARAYGMGTAMVAVSDDRTALYANPAGLNIYRHKAEFSIPTLTFNYNPATLDVGLLTGFRIRHFANPGEIDRQFVDELKDVEGQHINNIVLPEIGFVFRNFGVGIYGVSSLDAQFHAGLYNPYIVYSSQTDAVATAAISRRMFRPFSLGVGAKYVFRLQSPKTKVWGEDIEKIQIGELFGNQQDTLSLLEEIKHGLGVDLGALYHLGFLRVGAVMRNVIGSVADEKFDGQFDLGLGYWIPGLMHRGLLERVILAADVHDLFAGRNFWTKVHVGAEAELPLGALRFGFNQGYPTWGFHARMFVFHLEFASYSREWGQYPGHLRDKNYLLVGRVGL